VVRKSLSCLPSRDRRRCERHRVARGCRSDRYL
jgi:hypothetical protein